MFDKRFEFMIFFQTKILSTVSLDTFNPILRALPENYLSESEFPTQNFFERFQWNVEHCFNKLYDLILIKVS